MRISLKETARTANVSHRYKITITTNKIRSFQAIKESSLK